MWLAADNLSGFVTLVKENLGTLQSVSCSLFMMLKKMFNSVLDASALHPFVTLFYLDTICACVCMCAGGQMRMRVCYYLLGYGGHAHQQCIPSTLQDTTMLEVIILP